MKLQTILIIFLVIIVGIFFLDWVNLISIPNPFEKTINMTPTALQIGAIEDIVKLNSACYIGEVLVSYGEENEKDFEINKNDDIELIKNILFGKLVNYNFLNSETKEFLKKLGTDIKEIKEIKLENWKKIIFSNLCEKQEFNEMFNFLENRVKHFFKTYEDFSKSETQNYSEIDAKNIEYNLHVLNIKYKKNKKNSTEYSIELKKPIENPFRLIEWKELSDEVINEYMYINTNSELTKFFKIKRNRVDFSKRIKLLDENNKRVYFIDLLKKDKTKNEIKFIFQNLFSFCDFKSEIDEGSFNEQVEACKYDQNKIIPAIAKDNVFLKLNASDQVVLLTRGKVYASYDLNNMQCIYTTFHQTEKNEFELPGTLFAIPNNNKSDPDVNAIINPYLIFEKDNKINGFEIIYAKTKNDLFLKNSILSYLKKQCKDELEIDAMKNGILQTAKENAEDSLLKLVQMINAEKPGKIVSVKLIKNRSEISQSFGAQQEFNNEKEWVSVK